MNKFAHLIETHWKRPRCWLSILLLPLSWLFGLVVGVRTRMYRYGILTREFLPVPVVVIGNLHIGGSGKTPITAATARALQARGLNVGIISRGYGRKNHNTLIVNATGHPDDYGDEPLLLAQLVGAPVAVGTDRIAAGRLLLQHFPATQVIISDDGLQHYRLARDREIVIFPAADLAQRPRLLPQGALREPLSRLHYADMLMITNDGACAALPAWLPQHLNIYRSHLAYGDFYALNQPTHTVPARFFAGKKVVALAAIARPERFFDALHRQGLSLAATLALPDHAQLTPADMPQDAEAILITAKDAVKLVAFHLPQVWVLPVCAIIPSDFIDEICRDVCRN